MNLATEGIGWRWVRFGKGWWERDAIARRCPEIRRELNREAFWHLASVVLAFSLFLPALLIWAVLVPAEWLWWRVNGALPDIAELRAKAINDAHDKLPWTVIAERAGKQKPRIVTTKAEFKARNAAPLPKEQPLDP